MVRAFPLPRRSPESVGVRSADIDAFLRAADTGIRDMHSFMLVRDGSVIAESWWHPFAGDLAHSLFSLSKSFTSFAIGIAISEGRLTIDDRVVDLLPKDAPDVVSDNLSAMRVRHLLTMTTGHATDAMSTLHREEFDWVRLVLAQPVEFEPGSHFVYNSGATYLLSAILTRLTGERLLDYLRPRILDPLGMTDATWERCPRGIDVGGWGLAITTEDIAAFGQLCLQRGVWDARQLVPSDWVDAATSWQVSNADHEGGPDWRQGYGYQFWQCRHGAYRGDGAFGQFGIVLPRYNAVIAMTAATLDMQGVLDLVWTHLVPALERTESAVIHTAGSATADDSVAHAPVDLTVQLPTGALRSPRSAGLDGAAFDLDANSAELAGMTLDVDERSITLTLRMSSGDTHRISCGLGTWIVGAGPVIGDGRGPIAASTAWSDDDHLVLRLLYIETPFGVDLVVHPVGTGDIEVRATQNVSFGETALFAVAGRAAEKIFAASE